MRCTINRYHKITLNIQRLKLQKFTTTLVLIGISSMLFAQNTTSEKYGRTVNIGLGLGYYGYLNRSTPVFTINYEFDVAPHFTLAPFIGIFTHSHEYYWGNSKNPYRYYTYRETVIPIGLKGMYYFDDVLKLNSKWDMYLGGSLGFAVVNSRWENGYYGDKNEYRGQRPIVLDIHLGAEYHINNRVGIILDLSSGVSSIGLAIHGK